MSSSRPRGRRRTAIRLASGAWGWCKQRGAKDEMRVKVRGLGTVAIKGEDERQRMRKWGQLVRILKQVQRLTWRPRRQRGQQDGREVRRLRGAEVGENCELRLASYVSPSQHPESETRRLFLPSPSPSSASSPHVITTHQRARPRPLNPRTCRRGCASSPRGPQTARRVRGPQTVHPTPALRPRRPAQKSRRRRGRPAGHPRARAARPPRALARPPLLTQAGRAARRSRRQCMPASR